MLLVRAKRFLRDARPVASRMEPDRIERLDDPLFQEGNEIIARYGCVNELSPRKKAAIKDIGYDFPENGDPRIRLKASDKGFQLAGKENQKVGQKPAPGTLYSEIAEEIDGVNGLTPVVAPTVTRRSRDRLRLFRPGGQAAFPPPRPDPKPCHRPPVLYGSDGACSAPSAPQPNRKVPREPTTRPRPSVPRSASEPTATLEKQPTRSRRPAASYRPSSAPRASTRSRSRNPQDLAEGTFAAAELHKVEAVAINMGIPGLRGKQNVEIKGVGAKSPAPTTATRYATSSAKAPTTGSSSSARTRPAGVPETSRSRPRATATSRKLRRSAGSRPWVL